MISNNTMILAGKAGLVVAVSAVYYKASEVTLKAANVFAATITEPASLAKAGAWVGFGWALGSAAAVAPLIAYSNRMFSVTEDNKKDIAHFGRSQLMYTVISIALYTLVWSKNANRIFSVSIR